MKRFEPLGCKAFINIVKPMRQEDHKERENMAIFVGFDKFSIPGNKFYKPIYRDFKTISHCKLLDFN